MARGLGAGTVLLMLQEARHCSTQALTSLIRFLLLKVAILPYLLRNLCFNLYVTSN